MPHILVEFGGLTPPEALYDALCAALAAHPEVPASAVKLRAHRAEGFRLLSGEAAFVNVTLRLMETRPEAQHTALADAALAVLVAHLPESCAIGVETARIPKSSFRKRNGISDSQPKEVSMDDQTRTELEAAAFRRLQQHLMQERPDVQNIDLMNLAGFCRNCLSRWYGEAAAERGIDMSKEEAREAFYGMPYDAWKAAHQTEASDSQKQAFAAAADAPRDQGHS